MNTKTWLSAFAVASLCKTVYAATPLPAAMDANQGSLAKSTQPELQSSLFETPAQKNWTEANRTVEQIGGWQTYMAESGMDHSRHQGMDHSKHQGMDHSKHQGMDHSKHPGIDHSKHQDIDHSQHQGMDHSKHQGMDHSKHQGMQQSSAHKESSDAHSNHH
ncbi:hypothetical protein [Rheinheimera sp.]|uniref:hypothetical protein n=1 Tax=Rheinheimera sp. TaxID=1869214 RepID=UPI003AF43930